MSSSSKKPVINKIEKHNLYIVSFFDRIYTYKKYIMKNFCHDEGVCSSIECIGDLHIGHSTSWLAQDVQKPLEWANYQLYLMIPIN